MFPVSTLTVFTSVDLAALISSSSLNTCNGGTPALPAAVDNCCCCCCCSPYSYDHDNDNDDQLEYSTRLCGFIRKTNSTGSCASQAQEVLQFCGFIFKPRWSLDKGTNEWKMRASVSNDSRRDMPDVQVALIARLVLVYLWQCRLE